MSSWERLQQIKPSERSTVTCSYPRNILFSESSFDETGRNRMSSSEPSLTSRHAQNLEYLATETIVWLRSRDSFLIDRVDDIRNICPLSGQHYSTRKLKHSSLVFLAHIRNKTHFYSCIIAWSPQKQTVRKSEQWRHIQLLSTALQTKLVDQRFFMLLLRRRTNVTSSHCLGYILLRRRGILVQTWGACSRSAAGGKRWLQYHVWPPYPLV